MAPVHVQLEVHGRLQDGCLPIAGRGACCAGGGVALAFQVVSQDHPADRPTLGHLPPAKTDDGRELASRVSSEAARLFEKALALPREAQHRHGMAPVVRGDGVALKQALAHQMPHIVCQAGRIVTEGGLPQVSLEDHAKETRGHQYVAFTATEAVRATAAPDRFAVRPVRQPEAPLGERG